MNVPGRKKAVYPTHKAASKQTLGIEVEAVNDAVNLMNVGAPPRARYMGNAFTN